MRSDMDEELALERWRATRAPRITPPAKPPANPTPPAPEPAVWLEPDGTVRNELNYCGCGVRLRLDIEIDHGRCVICTSTRRRRYEDRMRRAAP